MSRTAHVARTTTETEIALTLDLDGTGKVETSTGIGFFDHMLTHLARHGLFDLTIACRGDLHIDAHHSVEDVGLCFGKALAQALGNKAGIRRFGECTLPMDETLATAAVDLSGRPFLVWRANLPFETLGTFSSQLAEEFWRAVSSAGLLTLHVVLHHGSNTHHIVEAIFKACAGAPRRRGDRPAVFKCPIDQGGFVIQSDRTLSRSISTDVGPDAVDKWSWNVKMPIVLREQEYTIGSLYQMTLRSQYRLSRCW